MFELMDGYSETAVIKVVGIGGGGGNAVAHMREYPIPEAAGIQNALDALGHPNARNFKPANVMRAPTG